MLVGYIKAWQNTINEVAALNGLDTFEFSTYLISVLVLFFLQVTYNFPTIKKLSSANEIQLTIENDRNIVIHKFFEFYANENIKSISMHEGRWHDPRAPPR